MVTTSNLARCADTTFRSDSCWVMVLAQTTAEDRCRRQHSAMERSEKKKKKKLGQDSRTSCCNATARQRTASACGDGLVYCGLGSFGSGGPACAVGFCATKPRTCWLQGQQKHDWPKGWANWGLAPKAVRFCPDSVAGQLSATWAPHKIFLLAEISGVD